MDKKPLHIINGTILTKTINSHKIEGEKLTWQEMLCEGPTIRNIDSEEFLKLRKLFLNEFYDIELNTDKITEELDKLNNPENYSEIILWFDHDLFSHINMVALISLIQQKKIELPIYLVRSGRMDGSSGLKSLSELSSKVFKDQYKGKKLLTIEDLEIATTVWGIYCGVDHNLLKPYIVKTSSFDYLSNCLKAHLKRFPDSLDGLNILERNILEIINKYKIKSKNHLLGYALNYQGFYGYGDLQFLRIIEQLGVFYTFENDSLELNRKGHEALLGHHNFSIDVDNNMIFGGVKKFNFLFSVKENKLIKSV